MPDVLLQDAEAWALRISARWRASIESIIETGQLLHDAKAALSHGEFGNMVKKDLPFGERTAQMLMAIAHDKRLSNPKHVSLLPPSWGTLYALTGLSDDEFERGVEQRIIRPDMERKDVAIIRPPVHRERSEPDSDGRADEAMARDVGAASGSLEASTTEALGEAGMGSERPGPSEADDILDVRGIIGGAPASHMAGRVHPAGDLDYSPTPPWATRALIERVLRHAGREGHCKFQTAWEPACGEGHMAEVLKEYFREVKATDLHPDYGYADAIGDFLSPDLQTPPGAFDWIITNPPFEDRVIKFMKRAIELAGTGVAMFVQLRYLEGIGRYNEIYRDTPPTIVAPFVERVPLLMGRYDPQASTTTAFMWLVWLKGAPARAPFWIPPGCRDALTKPDDAERFTQNPVRKVTHPPKAAESVNIRVTSDVEIPDIPAALRRKA